METASINSGDENIYRFVKSKYYKIYIPYYLLGILSWLIIAKCLILIFDSNNFAECWLIGYTIGYISGNIYRFFRIRNDSESNQIIFSYSDESPQAEVILFVQKFQKSYSIKKIRKMTKNRFYIKVVGELILNRTHFYKGYSSIFKRKCLRIPAYFENMDEIYSELEKLK